MIPRFLKHWTPWKVIGTLLLAAGAASTVLRFGAGLGASTNLSDEFPWGIWIGFDVLCGVGLAAGGFTLAALVYVFNLKRFEPIVRPTILTAFLGYILVTVGLMFDLGRPWAIWHAIIMWNPHSVMFEVAWCVMLYSTVLALEFAPVVLEKFKMHKTMAILHSLSIPIIILGVLLSTLHQSSLGTMYLIMPEKLYPLWYTPYLPIFFYVSAIGVGCAMVIFESFLSSRAFNRDIEMPLLMDLSRLCFLMIVVLGIMRTVDLVDRHAYGLLALPRMETYMFWLEIAVGTLAPIVLMTIKKVRNSESGLFWTAVLVITGFVMNRMNITITGMEGWAGKTYLPSLPEFSVTLGIVTAGFVAFYFIAKYFPVFTHTAHTLPPSSSAHEWIEEMKTVSRGEEPVRERQHA
ncbi:MAG: NrfD/PsrC family molybdoenzyme membrane anchor subunit [Acidobacteriota bacterium]